MKKTSSYGGFITMGHRCFDFAWNNTLGRLGQPTDWRIQWGLVGLICSVIWSGVASAQVWTQSGAPNKNWYAVATSADGNRLAAAVNSAGIYISTNMGKTWALTSAPNRDWSALASSADGKVLVGTATFTGTYTSTNFGSTWTSNSIPGNYQWDAAAASADGTTLIVAGNTWSPVYYSTNMGASWRSNGIPTGYWTGVACSADGTKLAAAWSGTVYVSTNGGAAWTNYNTSGGTRLTCSADGSRLLLFYNGLYLSTNWGVSWQQTGLPSSSSTLILAASTNLSRLVGVLGSSVYTSTDLGASWLASYAPAKTWRAMALSADGTKMVAAPSSSSDGIYLWYPPGLNYTNSGGNVIFTWPTNGTAFTLQVSSDLTSSNWANVTDAPFVTNSQNQITISPTNGGAFYRLLSQ